MRAAAEVESRVRGPRYGRFWHVEFFERDRPGALRALEGWESDAEGRPLEYGLTWLFLSGTPERAIPYLQTARRSFEAHRAELSSDPAYPEYAEYLEATTFLAEVLGYLGERDQALAYAEQVRPNLPERIPVWSPEEELHLKLIWAYIAAGDYATAIADLDHYLGSPAMWSIEGIMLDPRLDPIRDDPVFLALVQKYARR